MNLLDIRNLTFGIELETVGSVCFSKDEDDPGEGCIREMALAEIRSRGLKGQLVDEPDDTYGCEDDGTPDYTVWGISYDDTVFSDLPLLRCQYPGLKGLKGTDSCHTSWCPETHNIVHHAGVEFVSPIFSLMEHGKWSAEICTVLGTILSGQLHATVPKSAGFHVHIGLGTGRFSLEQIKKVAVTVILGEGAIDQFHAVHRRNDRMMIQPMITRRVFQDKSRGEIFDMIMEAKSLEEFKETVCGESVKLFNSEEMTFSRYYKVNFTNVDEDNSKGTIEFRQHAGTLNPREIFMWVCFVGQVVHSSCNMDVEQLRGIFVCPWNSSVGGSGMTPCKFLTLFVRNESVVRHYLEKIGVVGDCRSGTVDRMVVDRENEHPRAPNPKRNRVC